jgi:carbon monoxide dehydrogenase subunit G
VIIEGKFTLRAPIEKLWEMLLEPDTLGSCMPGAQKVERIDEKTYEAVVKQKVGPIKVTLKFKNILTKIEPPTHLELEGEGQDITKLGHFKQKTVVDLRGLDSGEVELSYRADVSIVGKLAMFGDRVMRSKAKDVEKEFTANLQNRLKSMEF